LKEALVDVSDAVACFRYYANAIVQFEKNEQNKKIEIEGKPITENTFFEVCISISFVRTSQIWTIV
jgi:hypothetical protein